MGGIRMSPISGKQAVPSTMPIVRFPGTCRDGGLDSLTDDADVAAAPQPCLAPPPFWPLATGWLPVGYRLAARYCRSAICPMWGRAPDLPSQALRRLRGAPSPPCRLVIFV